MKTMLRTVKEYINKLCEENGEFFKECSHKYRKAPISFVTYIRLFVSRPECISAVPNGQISVEYDIGNLYENLARNS